MVHYETVDKLIANIKEVTTGITYNDEEMIDFILDDSLFYLLNILKSSHNKPSMYDDMIISRASEILRTNYGRNRICMLYNILILYDERKDCYIADDIVNDLIEYSRIVDTVDGLVDFMKTVNDHVNNQIIPTIIECALDDLVNAVQNEMNKPSKYDLEIIQAMNTKLNSLRTLDPKVLWKINTYELILDIYKNRRIMSDS